MLNATEKCTEQAVAQEKTEDVAQWYEVSPVLTIVSRGSMGVCGPMANTWTWTDVKVILMLLKLAQNLASSLVST